MGITPVTSNAGFSQSQSVAQTTPHHRNHDQQGTTATVADQGPAATLELGSSQASQPVTYSRPS